MTTTAFVIAFMLGAPLTWEVLTLFTQLETISHVFRELGHEWTPFIIYAISVLPGHFFVNFRQSLVQAMGGTNTGEVVVVLWIGWAIFIVFRANPSWTPLGPWSSLALVIFSVLVGAFVWSQNPV